MESSQNLSPSHTNHPCSVGFLGMMTPTDVWTSLSHFHAKWLWATAVLGRWTAHTASQQAAVAFSLLTDSESLSNVTILTETFITSTWKINHSTDASCVLIFFFLITSKLNPLKLNTENFRIILLGKSGFYRFQYRNKFLDRLQILRRNPHFKDHKAIFTILTHKCSNLLDENE